MQLQIWSDYACPYCYIGKRHLQQALAEFEHADDVEVIFRTFELDPTAARQAVHTTQQRLELKYRKSPEATQDMINHIIAAGNRAGLEMKYRTARYTNTFDAHRLTRYAQTKGLGLEITERLFHAYFSENLELADHAVLLKIATGLGLDHGETQAMLKSDEFAATARAEEAQAMQLGVNAVPFFVLEGVPGMLGAQPKDVLLSALRESWKLTCTNATATSREHHAERE